MGTRQNRNSLKADHIGYQAVQGRDRTMTLDNAAFGDDY